MNADKSAFPSQIYTVVVITDPQNAGLTKRELFAAFAMAGELASRQTEHLDDVSIARNAVECADALLAELGGE